MLEVVVFAAIIGIALVTIPARQSKPTLELLGSVQQVCMTVVRWAMLLAPVAVLGLMMRLTASLGFDALLGIAVYVGTALVGFALILGVFLLATSAATTRSPLRVTLELRELLLLAFSTSSSAAVMPMTVHTAEDQLGVRPSISQFVVPLGATLNMSGTALYQGVATVFLIQAFGVELGVGQLALLVVMAVGASVGTPATPGVGIVILSMVLSAAGVPAAGVALIMGVDRILDMSRTAVNVAGDVFATVVVDRLVGGEASAQEELAQEAAHEEARAVSGEDVIVGEEASEDKG